MVLPFSLEEYRERQKKLKAFLKDSVLVLMSPPKCPRNEATQYKFRQSSNILYLTGFHFENCALVVSQEGVSLFAEPPNFVRAMWDGPTPSLEEIRSTYPVDEVWPRGEFLGKMSELTSSKQNVYYRLGEVEKQDREMIDILRTLKTSSGRTGEGLKSILDPRIILNQVRAVKTRAEIDFLKKVERISVEAHMMVMRSIRKLKTEKEVEGLFLYEIFKRGADACGYEIIAASGAHACILHYIDNRSMLREGDFFLLDAGGELHGYTADITRTYPISGEFSKAQRRIYTAVLQVQKAVIELCRPGVTFKFLQEEAVRLLSEEMRELGLLKGVDESNGVSYKKFYPHSIGHFLGLDVHDYGWYVDPVSREPKALEAGMVLTIEPGIYVPRDEPSEFRGLGVRIEDNILITESGSEVLTADCPKEVDEISALILKDG